MSDYKLRQHTPGKEDHVNSKLSNKFIINQVNLYDIDNVDMYFTETNKVTVFDATQQDSAKTLIHEKLKSNIGGMFKNNQNEVDTK